MPSSTATNYYDIMGTEDYTFNNYTSCLSEFDDFIVLLIDYYVDAIGYIKRIFKLTKWYIVFMFNCFRIRAPCKK